MNSAKEGACFWTVYGHLKTGGVDALVDCADEQNADRCAAIVRSALRIVGQGRTVARCVLLDGMDFNVIVEVGLDVGSCIGHPVVADATT